MFQEKLERPLLKKIQFDKEVYKIIFLYQRSLLTKILVKDFVNRLDKYLDKNLLRDPLQLAYRQHNSKKTELLQVNHDINGFLKSIVLCDGTY